MSGMLLFKLGGLAIRQAAKPVAGLLKDEATKRPSLRKVYVKVGQAIHRATVRITIAASGHKNLGIKALEEDAAFARGADALGEFLVLFVGSSVIIFEVNRSNRSAAAKEAAKAASRQKFYDSLQMRFNVLEARLDAMEKEQSTGWAKVLRRKEQEHHLKMAEMPPLDPRQQAQQDKAATSIGSAGGRANPPSADDKGPGTTSGSAQSADMDRAALQRHELIQQIREKAAALAALAKRTADIPTEVPLSQQHQIQKDSYQMQSTKATESSPSEEGGDVNRSTVCDTGGGSSEAERGYGRSWTDWLGSWFGLTTVEQRQSVGPAVNIRRTVGRPNYEEDQARPDEIHR